MSGTATVTRYCSRCLTTFPTDADRCPNLSCRSTRPANGWGELLGTGQVIDRTYRVHAMLAIGGAGVTYLAGELGADGQSEVGPRVAVKVLYQQRDQGPYLRRLATEAQILQGLAHPNIVECRGFVHRAGHLPYLVTKFEAGGSLLDHVRRVGTLSIPVTAAIGRQICWALDVAHRQGVIHRDLKPENVLLSKVVAHGEIPEVRVADFGIAKVYGGVGDRLTRVGAFVGTPQYAAPEQFDGLTPEPATDLYAVGALLYFCVAGRPVADHMGELDPESQKIHLLRFLPPRTPEDAGRPELRAWFDACLAEAMAVDPGDRCDILQLEQRLAALAEDRDPGKVRPTSVVSHSTRTVNPDERSNVFSRGAPRDVSLDPITVQPATEAERAAIRSATGTPAPQSDVSPPKYTTTPPKPAPDPRPSVTKPVVPAAPTRTTTVARPPRRGGGALGGVVAGLTLLLGVVLVIAAGAVGVWLWLSASPEAVTLTATETDPTRRDDWTRIAAALGTRGVEAERACRTPGYLQLAATVAADGSLQRLEVLNYEHEPTRLCLEKHLAGTSFPRAGTGLVRVSVALQE